MTAMLVLGLAALLVASLGSADPADPPGVAVHPPNDSVRNLAGAPGALMAHGLMTALGAAAWLVAAAVLSLGIGLARNRDRDRDRGRVRVRVRAWQWVCGWSLLLVSACAALHGVVPGLAGGLVVGSGGYVGAWSMIWLAEQLTVPGCQLLIGSMAVSGLLLSGEAPRAWWLLRKVMAPAIGIGRLLIRVLGSRHEFEDGDSRRAVRPRVSQSLATDVEAALASEVPAVRVGGLEVDGEDLERDEEVETDFPAMHRIDAEIDTSPRQPVRVNPPPEQPSEREEIFERLEAVAHEDDDEHDLPDLDLLEEAEEVPYALLTRKAQVAAITLEQSFREFGLCVRVVAIDTGPVITQFELELEAGLRLSKVSRLADDLAIALRVPTVRVVAPIPGKNTVGIEVPNEQRVMVRLRELIETSPREAKDKRLPVFLGKDVSGRPLVIDLAQMPHLLIAGRTGTGKSVCLNSLILSLLMTRRPDEVRMLMIDPKMVELSPYRRIPHLMHPVITDMKKAEAVLAWAVDKMEDRYDLLARCGVRHLDSFNALCRSDVLDRLGLEEDDFEAEEIPERMPYIVIVADEIADMMMSAGKDVERHIIRLAQKSRAVGIHLVLATQKPTVDVITGLIKSNLPARVSFQVASRTDSRVVLDEIGADKLLGHGDMLYLTPGTSHLVRAQGTFVSDEEVNAVIDFFSEVEPRYSDELTRISSAGGAAAAGLESLKDRDELYEQAIEVVIREGRGSVSLLQRCLGIGYGRAARLIDFMAEDGVVGDYNGSQAREVMYTSEEWQAFQGGEESLYESTQGVGSGGV
jgi:S-DNA-T family DNA segregation ATPase FtsK/SpoIIIE